MDLQDFSDISVQWIARKAKEDAEKICAKNEWTNEQEYDIIYTSNKERIDEYDKNNKKGYVQCSA